MDKYYELYDESEYSDMSVFYKTNGLVTINKDYKGECGLFINDTFLVILNKKYNERYFHVGLHDLTKKNGLLAKKVILDFSIDNSLVTIDFTFSKERDEFIDKLNEIIDLEKAKREEETKQQIQEQKRQEEIQRKRANMPYEELKKLKELYDLDILTEEEYIIKRDELLKDYI
ncbi:SHOCT domain-containing protein [Mammaliicoccus sp. E-M26]|uniref:SHOCT domain-containing protein n=1 Tax=Mammaliicoccus sp. E-M26 TaxID=2898686 RepID=UPI001EFBB13E|nr:SHOCT domain-containing protein [Mammaliicoccus sp. E-M26]